MIKPLANFVLLTPKPPMTQTAGGILLIESNRWSVDNYEWLVVACGTSVPFDIQPGMRVLLDPTSMAQRDFEHNGVKYKVAPWKEVKMVIGVPNENS